MGLDITHYKLTLEEPNVVNSMNVGRNLLCDLKFFKTEEIKYVQPFIQQIEICKVRERIWYANDEKQYQNFLKSKVAENNNIIFEKDPIELRTKIESEEKKRGLNLLKNYEVNVIDWSTINYYEFEFEEGFYCIEVGYQRKGVNNSFWKRFKNENNIYNFMCKQDFEHAYNSIDFYWDSDTNEDVQLRKKLFKENFMDKYTEGESYLSLSY